jgi:pimeloyl-ACP methyl ester carboxylesterase
MNDTTLNRKVHSGCMKTFHWVIIVLCVWLTGCAPASKSTQTSDLPGIVLADCQLSAPGLAARIPAKCGNLLVYEDRVSNTGRQISLKVAVIPAVSRNPAPDPLFFLTGGPGQAATESFVFLSPAFDRIHLKRDIVLVDQRGTGKSNPLVCPTTEESITDDTPDAELAEFLAQCIAEIDARPELFTTSIAMQDLDDVRNALGYERINLYGVSYGTRAALTYMGLFPERVRSAILDGVVPQDEPIGLTLGEDAQRALDLMFERCANQPGCAKEFPDLRFEFTQLLKNLRAEPVDVSLPHPVSGEETEMFFTADKFATAVRLFTYSQETVALLPFMIHTAFTENEYNLMVSNYLIVAGDLEESITEGMGYSVLCSEDIPFISIEEARKNNADTYLGAETIDQLFEICKTWPHTPTPASFKQPIRSDTPVLLLSGEADPVTPPSNGDQVAATLSHSLHLVAPGQGHNIIYRGCIPILASEFIENTDTEMDVSCVDKIQPSPFFVNYSGPVP